MAIRAGAWLLLFAGVMAGQTYSNQTLNGKYWFRHLLFSTDTSDNLTDIRSLWGAMQFDGAGNYSFNGQASAGGGATAPSSGSGTYSMNSAGIVTLTNPQAGALTLNARWGSVAANEGMLVGSSTEGTANTFDLFVAIQAPPDTMNVSLTNSYFVSTLAFPSGTASLVRSGMFSLQPSGFGGLANFSVSGHAANLLGGASTTQAMTRAFYALYAGGTGVATFPLQTGLDLTTQLVSGNKAIFISSGGNVILGGANDGSAQDILVGFTAGSGLAWTDKFWQAGLRFESAGNASAYSGSLYSTGTGTLTFTRRLHQLQPSGAVTYDFTGTGGYTLTANGTGTALASSVALGAAGNGFAGTAADSNDPAGFELYAGVRLPAVSGTGVFLNPLGVFNAASLAPSGEPIAPGEFVALFGTNLASAPQQTKPPYPASLGGVSVLVDGVVAPVYAISPTLVFALVPYSTAGPTATFTVTNNGTTSNPVEVPVAATAPGVFSLSRNGIGPAAIQHVDFTTVTSAKPAKRGETVVVYLTGLGAVTPPVTDAAGGGAKTLSRVNSATGVLIGGLPATVKFAGLVPGVPGLYIVNVVVPADLPVTTTGPFPLAIQTPGSFHDQVDLIVGP